jgi:hypothetical protein
VKRLIPKTELSLLASQSMRRLLWVERQFHFDAPAKTVNIEVQEPKCNAFRRRFAPREFNLRIETQAARGVAFNWAITGLSLA